jgi:type VI secretion system protein ImpL
VTLLTPPKGTKSGKPMRLPDFPEGAPELPESVISKANESVLVNGTVEDIEPQDQPEEPMPEPIEAPAPKDDKKKEEKPAADASAAE